MSVESFVRNRATYRTRNIDGYKYTLYFAESSPELFLSAKKKVPFLPIYRPTKDEPVFVCVIGKHDNQNRFFYKSEHGTISSVGPGFLHILIMADLMKVTDTHTGFEIMKELRRD